MWKRKGLLNWNRIRFGQTSGSACQESRSLNEGMKVLQCSVSHRSRKRSFNDWVTGLRVNNRRISVRKLTWNCYRFLRDAEQQSLTTLRPVIMLRCEKGQPDGFAIKSNTRQPGAADMNPVFVEAAGHNNSNLTPFATTVVGGEWELIQKNSSHYCFIYTHVLYTLLLFSPDHEIISP